MRHSFVEPPSRGGRKLLLPKTKTDLGPQEEDWIFKGEHIVSHLAEFPVVLLFVQPDKLANYSDIALGLDHAFEDHAFICFLAAHRAVRILRQILCFSRLLTGAEIKQSIHPQRPYDHYVRTAIGASSRDPVLPAFLQPIFCPLPRQEAFLALWQAVARDAGTRGFWRARSSLRASGHLMFTGSLITTKDTKLHEGKTADSPSWLFVSLVVNILFDPLLDFFQSAAQILHGIGNAEPQVAFAEFAKGSSRKAGHANFLEQRIG